MKQSQDAEHSPSILVRAAVAALPFCVIFGGGWLGDTLLGWPLIMLWLTSVPVCFYTGLMRPLGDATAWETTLTALWAGSYWVPHAGWLWVLFAMSASAAVLGICSTEPLNMEGANLWARVLSLASLSALWMPRSQSARPKHN